MTVAPSRPSLFVEVPGSDAAVLIGKDGSAFNTLSWNGKNNGFEKFLDKKYAKMINIAGKMKLNEWRGKENIEFVIEDISLN